MKLLRLFANIPAGWRVFFALALGNILIFSRHYRGKIVFPWDFLIGYHAHTFGWFADGNIFNPPAWFPWTNGGFPASVALQTGGWYLPFGLLRSLDIAYTMRVATVVQCLHVLAGALGVYALLRAFKVSPLVSAVAAMAFQFSGGLFSELAHPDIIRGITLLPWLLYLLHPEVLLKSPLRPLVAALVFFQYFVCAYPGMIVSAGYLCAFYCLFMLWEYRRTCGMGRYVAALLLVLLPALAMAGVKWLPFLASGEVTARVEQEYFPFLPEFLFTLFLPYDKPFLGGEIIRRSLYLALPALAGVFLVKNRTVVWRTGLLLFVVSFFFGCLLSSFGPEHSLFPGMSLSRFPVTVWRPGLQIGLLFMAAQGWSDLAQGELSRRNLGLRALLLTVFCLLISAAAWRAGYSGTDFLRPALVFAVLAGLLFLWGAWPDNRASLRFPVLGVCLVLLVIVDGISFHRGQMRPWNQYWNQDFERYFYHTLIPDTYDDRRPLSLIRRPPRLDAKRELAGQEAGQVSGMELHPFYNGCWYYQKFGLFGYDVLHFFPPALRRNEALADPLTGDLYRTFLLNPQQVVLIGQDEAFDITSLSLSEDEYLSNRDDVSAQVLLYTATEVAYKVTSPAGVTAVENETWAQGWTYMFCQDALCYGPEETFASKGFLRSWSVPPGEWLVKLKFTQPLLREAYLVFAAGLGLALFYAALALRRKRGQDPRLS